MYDKYKNVMTAFPFEERVKKLDRKEMLMGHWTSIDKIISKQIENEISFGECV